MPLQFQENGNKANPLVPDIVNHFDTAALLQAMRGYQRASKQKATT